MQGVPVAFATVASLLVADFAFVLHRARREWRRSDDISTSTAYLITSLYALTAALLVMAVVWRPWPLSLPTTVALVVGAVVSVGGVALAAPGFVPFPSVKQLYGVDRGGLITSGIYRYSRNPQYTGMGIAIIGVALIARSGLALTVVAAYWIAIRLWLVLEERHLEETFGSEYVAYRGNVARFLGPSATSRRNAKISAKR